MGFYIYIIDENKRQVHDECQLYLSYINFSFIKIQIFSIVCRFIFTKSRKLINISTIKYMLGAHIYLHGEYLELFENYYDANEYSRDKLTLFDDYQCSGIRDFLDLSSEGKIKQSNVKNINHLFEIITESLNENEINEFKSLFDIFKVASDNNLMVYQC